MTVKRGNWRLHCQMTSCVGEKGRCLCGKWFGAGDKKEGGRVLLVTCLLHFFIIGMCQSFSVSLSGWSGEPASLKPELIGPKERK